MLLKLYLRSGLYFQSDLISQAHGISENNKKGINEMSVLLSLILTNLDNASSNGMWWTKTDEYENDVLYINKMTFNGILMHKIAALWVM